MSCYWNVQCVDCGPCPVEPVNRGQTDIENLVRLAPALAKFAGDLEPVELHVEVRVGWGDRKVNLDWFAKHGYHQLKACSEYGDVAK